MQFVFFSVTCNLYSVLKQRVRLFPYPSRHKKKFFLHSLLGCRRNSDMTNPQGSVYIKQIRPNTKVAQNQVFLPSLTTIRCPKNFHRPACSSHNETGCVTKDFLRAAKLGFIIRQELELFWSPPRSNCFRVSSGLLSSGYRYLPERYSNRRQEITALPY